MLARRSLLFVVGMALGAGASCGSGSADAGAESGGTGPTTGGTGTVSGGTFGSGASAASGGLGGSIGSVPDAACLVDGDGRTTLAFVNGCEQVLEYAGSDIPGGTLAPGAADCVDAFNLPMRIVPVARPDCDTLTCEEDLLPGCPDAGLSRDSSGAVTSCVSPDRDDAQSPVALYFESCDDAYAWSGDDQQGTDPSPVKACAGEDWEITFCPAR